MSFSDPHAAIKAMLWEEAKGKLRALASVQGSYPANIFERGEQYEKSNSKIEEFIQEFEEEGLWE